MKMKQNQFHTKFLGNNRFYYETIDSTQKEIWRRVEQNKIENGTILIANIQTDGIGTHGRTWYTDTRNNIAFSFFLEANCKPEVIQDITIEIAKTLVEVFQRLYHITLNIKFPNDIMYQNKKIAGILTETKIRKEQVKSIVIGIGINTNQETFAEEIENVATSIKKEFGIEVENELVIEKFCELFETKIIEKYMLT